MYTSVGGVGGLVGGGWEELDYISTVDIIMYFSINYCVPQWVGLEAGNPAFPILRTLLSGNGCWLHHKQLL